MKLTPFEANIQRHDVVAADKDDGGAGAVLQPSRRICCLTILSAAFWALVFYLHSSMQAGDGVASVLFKQTAFSLPQLSITIVGRSPPSEQAPPPPPLAAQENRRVTAPSAAYDRCAGRYIYMYDLPPRFNDDIVRDCRNLRTWMDMCPYVANSGMGPALGDGGGAFSDHGWYNTEQFFLDIIFHGRMKRYECLTGDSSLAAAVFVPFYASLDTGRFLFNSTTARRDVLTLDLVEWLARRPEWRTMGGRDHFLMAGRTTWDLHRLDDADEGWGPKLLNNPAVENMTALLLEVNPFVGSNIAVPYPTYFHPETAADVLAWQEKVRAAERRWLFSFAGAPRPGSSQTVRGEIIRQCGASSRCGLYNCAAAAGGGGGGGGANCNSPGGVMRLFESSSFCLQPRGDTLTRRSTFDTILAGCIPVFFHPGSAYLQYTVHLPREPNKYSVLITHTDITGRNVSIEETLSKIPPETVRAMREEVIALIPRVVYADPRSRRVDFKDAFDVAVEAVIDRVAKRRQGMAAGREQ